MNMTDIVERLKERANWCLSGPFITVEGSKIYTEAANEIERLQAALKDAQTLIDNDLVGPWMAKHKLDEILK